MRWPLWSPAQACSSFVFWLAPSAIVILFFFFNDTATTGIYTLSLHELFRSYRRAFLVALFAAIVLAIGMGLLWWRLHASQIDRKSTRLNSSHTVISYAVFCLKKKRQY